MKRVYLVRHGETNANASDVVQGHEDPLSELGMLQARALAERFSRVPFDNLITSDYTRAFMTAEVIAAATDTIPSVTPLLRETRRPSEFVGTSRNSVEYFNFFQQANDFITDPSWHYSDEENFFDVIERAEALFSQLEKLEGDTVVVTHGRFIMVLVAYVIMGRQLNASMWKLCMNNFLTSNTGISVLEYDPDHEMWRLLTFNDRAHFAD